jgi:hypothetical protein
MTHHTTNPNGVDDLVQLVENLTRYVRSTDSIYAPNYKTGVRGHPIPFFGNLLTAEVITIGLNPSADEFKSHRAWPEALTPGDLTRRLLKYFDREPHPWFARWEQGLSSIGASYRRNAVHLDVTPRATVSAATVPDRGLLEKMAEADLPWMLRFLALVPTAKLLLLAGSIHRGMYLNEFLSRYLPLSGSRLEGSLDRPRGVKGFVRYHTLLSPPFRLPMFFCSSGPSNRNNPQLLAERVAQESHSLRQLLSSGMSQ